MACYEIDGILPVVHPSAFVHPDAVLIGDVIIGPNCYVAPLASLRGDFGRIIMEKGSNIQEGCVMHGFPGSDTVIEENGHVGHGAILHGCRVGKNALIGMNSVIMDNAIIGEYAFVAASSFVKAGMEVPAKTLVAGTPAKVVRELSETEMKWKSEGTKTYQELAVRSATTMKICTPLTEVEANRKRFESKLKSLIDTKKESS